MTDKKPVSWLRMIGYILVTFVLLGGIAAAVTFGTVISIPILIVFLIHEYHRDKSEPEDQ